MGMWQGLYMGMQNVRERRERREEREERRQLILDEREEARRAREEDRAFRRELLNRQLFEAQRERMLQTLAERRQLSSEVQGQINDAVALGLNRTAAEALYRAGQLGPTLTRFEERGMSRNEITAFSDEVVRQLAERGTEEQIAATLVGAANSGADLTDPREAELALMESLMNAVGIEELQELYPQVLEVGSRGPRVQPFELSFSTEGVDQTEARRIRSGIIQRLGPLFGPDTFEITNSGDYAFAPNAPEDLVNLVTNLTDQVIDVASTPGANQMDSVDAVIAYTNPIIEARNQGQFDVEVIQQNLPTLFDQGADPFLQAVIAPVVTPPEPTPEVDVISVPGDNPVGDAMTAFTEMGTGAQRRENRRGGGLGQQSTPDLGFSPDVWDEIE